jgi:adenylate cyclase class IV
MYQEKEITVLVTSSYEELHDKLLENNFKLVQKFKVIDEYLVEKNTDLNLPLLEILKKCVLVRNIVGYKKVLLYKHKIYDYKGNILENGKTECLIENIESAIKFMEEINYQKLIAINDQCIKYINDKIELIVQLVNDKYIFIEVEEKMEIIKANKLTFEEIIEIFKTYDLPYDKTNYYAKKAEMILKDKLNNK